MISLDNFKKLVKKDSEKWYASLQITLRYGIDNPNRLSSFLAQTLHESAYYTRLVENLNYNWLRLKVIFPKYFPTDDLCMKYERKPELIANRVYANRMGNGSELSGDGWKFRGRGLIQITGRNNYTMISTTLGKELSETISYLETPDGAVESACIFWDRNKLNTYADKCDIRGMTKVINGGYIGLSEREELFKKVLGLVNG